MPGSEAPLLPDGTVPMAVRNPLPRTFVLLFALATLAGAGPGRAAVVINELLGDPARDWDGDGAVDARGDEWIEVLNTGPGAEDLAEYWVRDDAAGQPRLNLSGLLAPGETAVFYGSDALVWQAAVGQTAAGLSLNNGGDRVVLLRTVPGTDPVLYEDVDVVDYGDHVAEDDRSCGWSLDRTQWVLFDALLPYGGSLEPVATGCAPTPGAANLCDSSVDAEDTSFGGVKASFR
jgi:hypothetical protein